ncbi:MAG TPA: hypothetical protein VJL80_09985 [Aeromicrobium sp.]|nr:hypothetical protein [Aeromicrobium sp.]HKY58356.1 hypothetical protein [Aeromicrobium sp.]
MTVNQVRRNGSFAPLSAHYYDDDAIIAAGEKAEVLFTRGLAFAARKPADGFITDLQLTTFRLSAVTARAKRLCEVGLWERVEDDLLGTGTGYRIRSWLKHNASRAEIEEKQRKDAARKRGGQS